MYTCIVTDKCPCGYSQLWIVLLSLIKICFVKIISPIVVEVMGLYLCLKDTNYSIAKVTNFDKYCDCK